MISIRLILLCSILLNFVANGADLILIHHTRYSQQISNLRNLSTEEWKAQVRSLLELHKAFCVIHEGNTLPINSFKEELVYDREGRAQIIRFVS